MFTWNNRLTFLKSCIKQYKRQLVYSRELFQNSYLFTYKTINTTNKINLFCTSPALGFSKNKSVSQKNQNLTNKIKFVAIFVVGALVYFFYQLRNLDKSDEIVLDLNEIYESCALIFLANPEVQFQFDSLVNI